MGEEGDTGKEQFALCFSGPIRSAGGTGASVCVLIADYVRKKMGYDTYDSTEEEQGRIEKTNSGNERSMIFS